MLSSTLRLGRTLSSRLPTSLPSSLPSLFGSSSFTNVTVTIGGVNTTSIRTMANQPRTMKILSGRHSRGIIHSLRATGNNVSHSKRKTRRTFLPNVFKRSLYSELCDRKLGPLHISASGLRDIDKCGGLDNYCIYNPYKRTIWEGNIKKIRDKIVQMKKKKAWKESQGVEWDPKVDFEDPITKAGTKEVKKKKFRFGQKKRAVGGISF
jgi:ribosomal protein L28